VAEPFIPRLVADGVVMHPLTLAVEFTSTDSVLVRATAAAFDRVTPVGQVDILRMLHAVSPAARRQATWVMDPGIWLRARDACSSQWAPILMGDELFLAGRPVELVDGAPLQIRVDVACGAERAG
jgi:hypothetical protein